MFVLVCAMLMSQAPANRANKTIVADVLAQMPAAKVQDYNNLMRDLASTGSEGVIQLASMMNAPGKGSNAAVEYALSGLSHYVSAQGEESSRTAVSEGLMKAIDNTSERETKAFLIRQLEIAAKDEAVQKLSSFLTDSSLSGPAARALSAISTPAAGEALLTALDKVTDEKSKKDIIVAIAEMQPAGAEAPLRKLIGSGDENMQKTVLYALSRTGSKLSLPDLAKSAAKANYAMDKTGGTEAYIALIKRVLQQGDIKDADKNANELLKNSQKAGQVQASEAALEILMAANPSDVFKLLKKALESPDSDYRSAALKFASDYSDANMYAELFKLLNKATPQVKTDIINQMITDCNDPSKCQLIEKQGTGTFAAILNGKDNAGVKKSAAEVLAKIGNHESIVALADLLGSNDEQTVLLGRDLLATVNGDIGSAIVPVVSNATDNGKIAILQLLAARKADSKLPTVLEYMNSNSPEVKAAAYTALKDVVMEKDIPALYTMLEKATAEEIQPIQEAIVQGMKNLSSEKQLEQTLTQMNSTDQSKQYLYYPLLISTGNIDALNIIADRFEKVSGNDKDAAFNALLLWKGTEAKEILYAISKDKSASKYSMQALDRFIRLASSPTLSGENRRLLLTDAMEIAQTDAQKNAILSHLGNTGSYLGMLLAGEYLDSKPVQQAAAGAVMKIALANKDYTGKNVETLLNKVIQVLDNPDADYQREAIRKHLGEIDKGEGYVPIFNGKDLSGWKGLVENPFARAKMKQSELSKKQIAADELAKKHWSAQNGILVFDGGRGGDNLCTDKQYGDFEMYIDWKLDPAGPEADAGIYLRGTPQVQIWDISRVDVGAQVGSGGLYNNTVNPRDPLVLADNKLGEWNTFYIKMVGDCVTVMLNGELVVDNVILENYWDRSQPIFPKEQIELQAHGSKVYYRNIYVKELERPEPYTLTEAEKKEGYRILFDGTNMHEWTGNTYDYRLEDGCISLHPSVSHGGNLYTKDEFSDFIFRFEFQLTPAANNGLGIRTPMEGDAAYVGMELQILDNEDPVYKDLQVYQYHGSVYGIIPAKRGFLKPVGEWNYQEVVADGDHIKVTLNGTVILDGNIREATKNGTADKLQHPGLFNEKGHIGFLGHGSPVKFKNIRIKELK